MNFDTSLGEYSLVQSEYSPFLIDKVNFQPIL